MDSKSLRLIVAIAGLTAMVGGCTTLDAYTQESKTSNATKGAVIGAVSGAVVGLISGDDSVERRKHALIGAGVGALAGGAIGYYMDQQEAKLRAELEGTGVTNSSNLSPAFFDVLNSVSIVLTEFDQTIVEVAGHTDSDGSVQYNQGLSERRAQSVAQYFRTQEIMDQRLITVGLGEARPISDNSTASGKQANRRVEITMVPVTA
jgi:outer membrane protein OmpA-like peptidoglycan-associated protein